MQVVRRAARAILIDGSGRLVVFKRTVPKRKVYWSTPGGGVDAEDGSVEAALHRELFEELGATVDRAQQVFLTSPARGDGIAVQHFFVCRLVTMDIRQRTGSEFSNPAKGRYDVERFDLRAKKPKLARVDLQPREARDFILDNRAALLGAVLDDDMPPLMAPPPVPDPVVVEVEVVRVERVLAAPAVAVEVPPAAYVDPTTGPGVGAAEPEEAATGEATWSDADDAAARDDSEALVHAGALAPAGGRRPGDRSGDDATAIVAPTPLGAGLLPDPSQRRVHGRTDLGDDEHDGVARRAGPDVDPEPASEPTRRPWYRRMFGQT